MSLLGCGSESRSVRTGGMVAIMSTAHLFVLFFSFLPNVILTVLPEIKNKKLLMVGINLSVIYLKSPRRGKG